MCRIESEALILAESQRAAGRLKRSTERLISAHEIFLGQALSRRLGRTVVLSFTDVQRTSIIQEFDRCARLNSH